MNIGFDLDKIFIDYPPFIPDSLIDSLYRKTSSSTLSYRIPSLPEQIIRKVSHHSIFRPPIKNNISFMRGIFAKKKNKYFLISSRFGFLKRETYIILKKYQLDKLFHGIHFNFNNEQPHLFKNKTIQQLHIDYYIDDDLPLLKFLAKKNPNKKFFWLNKQTGTINKNIFGIKHLAEIFS